MPDQAKEPAEKEGAQDSALIKLLVALANRRDSVSRGRSRLSRVPQHRDEKANEGLPYPPRGRASQLRPSPPAPRKNKRLSRFSKLRLLLRGKRS